MHGESRVEDQLFIAVVIYSFIYKWFVPPASIDTNGSDNGLDLLAKLGVLKQLTH